MGNGALLALKALILLVAHSGLHQAGVGRAPETFRPITRAGLAVAVVVAKFSNVIVHQQGVLFAGREGQWRAHIPHLRPDNFPVAKAADIFPERRVGVALGVQLGQWQTVAVAGAALVPVLGTASQSTTESVSHIRSD